MTVFFTSDHHFGHRNIITYCGRPFSSLERMHERLVKNWNMDVKPEDQVWVLGDFILGRLDELAVLERLNGEKILVPGNHDYCWVRRSKHRKFRQAYLDAGFSAIVDDPDPIWHEGHKVLVSHFPFRGTGDHRDAPERYREYKPLDKGEWLLHGHVHERWRIRGRQINVGVDAWAGYPWRLDALLHYVTERNPHDREPFPWGFAADLTDGEVQERYGDIFRWASERPGLEGAPPS